MMNPNPFMDPFFARPPKTYENTKADICRQHRDLIRQYSQSDAMKVSAVVFRYVQIFMLGGLLTIPGLVIFQIVTQGRWYHYPIAFLIAAIVAFIPYFFWSRTQKIVKAMAQLAQVHGGSWGNKRLINILDWFDAHWPAEHPLEVVAYLSPVEDRWDWQSTIVDRPVLLIVHRPLFVGNSPGGQNAVVQRMSFFLPSPTKPAPPLAESHPALRELEQLGYWVKHTEAGVFITHTGIDVQKLSPEFVYRVLYLASHL